MAKKKSHKKHSFKYAEPVVKPATSAILPPTGEGKSSRPVLAPVVSMQVEYPYLKGDLSRLGLLAASLILAEFALWYLFGHSSLGQTVYNLYQVGK